MLPSQPWALVPGLVNSSAAMQGKRRPHWDDKGRLCSLPKSTRATSTLDAMEKSQIEMISRERYRMT